MFGAGVQFNRNRNGDDWFYSAAKARRSKDFLRRAQSDVTSRRSRCDELQQVKSRAAPTSAPVSGPSTLCNLERFLESVTPFVQAQYLSKMTLRNWRTCNVEFQPFFVLGDLWASFKEWSAYGAGVPLLLNESESAVQYYVPYLSGIQLYADFSRSTAKLRRLGDESDSEYFRDSSSDGSSDSEEGRSGSVNSRTSSSSLGVDQFPSRERHVAFQEGFSSDEGEPGSSRSCLLFEYLARDPPYCREPLADKISGLAHGFPELGTLRSCDLLPSSWISVAWYPIYRIPTGPTLKDLDACFLTFHSLHTPMTGSVAMHPPAVTYPMHPPAVTYQSESDGVPQISLPVFGLASYKYKVSLWTPNAGHQRQLGSFLLQAAENWLNSLHVHHPDFSFFCRK